MYKTSIIFNKKDDEHNKFKAIQAVYDQKIIILTLEVPCFKLKECI